MINGINTNQRAYVKSPTNAAKEANEIRDAKERKDTTDSAAKTDKIDISKKQNSPVTYSNIKGKKGLGSSEVEVLKTQAEQAYENLRNIVEKLILNQSKGYKISTEIEKIQLSPEEVEAAKLSVSEEGEYGVKAVSDRLVNFAISVSGGDKSKFAVLVDAINEGFKAAQEAWGGQLPDICNQT